MLDEFRRLFFALKKSEVLLLQSTEEASAIYGIESAISDGRQLLLKFIKFANYNEELLKDVMRLKVSYEAWVSLELELVKKKAVLVVDPGNRTEHAELDLLVPRITSSFLIVMDVLGNCEKHIHSDIELGAAAIRGILVSTLVFIVYLLALPFWRDWSTARMERRYYKNFSSSHI